MTLFSSWRQRSRRRGHAANKYAHGLDFFFCDFPADFPLLFSLCLSLFNFHVIGHLSHIFVLALLIHGNKQGFWKKTRSKSIFRTQFFKFFRHLKASGVFPVCVSGLILWAYKVTVLAHTKKPTLIESMNKWGCEGRSKSHCQQLRKNTLRQSKGYKSPESKFYLAINNSRSTQDNHLNILGCKSSNLFVKFCVSRIFPYLILP